jgi:hypothetical protein
VHAVSDKGEPDLTPSGAVEPQAARPAEAAREHVAQGEAVRSEAGLFGAAREEAARPETVESGAADSDVPSPESVSSGSVSTGPVSRRRRIGIAVLLAVAAIAGAIGSWVYNHGYKVRAANNSAIVRSGAELSTFVSPGDYTAVTVPIRNDSPYDVTVIGLTVPNAPKLVWDHRQVVVPPNATTNLTLYTRGECAASPHPIAHRQPVTVVVRVLTINGKMHGSLQELISGAIQYADDVCAIPSASETY